MGRLNLSLGLEEASLAPQVWSEVLPAVCVSVYTFEQMRNVVLCSIGTIKSSLLRRYCYHTLRDQTTLEETVEWLVS